MTNSSRKEARTVILRLRQYRDRIREMAAALASPSTAGGSAAVINGRRLASLKTDLDHDAHECTINRKRLVQSECEHEFLWPALCEAAAAIGSQPAQPSIDASAGRAVSGASIRIQHYLTQLESRWPTL